MRGVTGLSLACVSALAAIALGVSPALAADDAHPVCTQVVVCTSSVADVHDLASLTVPLLTVNIH